MAAILGGIAASLLPSLFPETIGNIGHYIEHNMLNQKAWEDGSGRHRGSGKKRKYAGLNPGLAAYLEQREHKKAKIGDGREDHHLLTQHGAYQYNGPHKNRIYKANGLTPTAGPIQFANGVRYGGKRGHYKMSVTYHGINGTTQRSRIHKARGIFGNASDIPTSALAEGPMP